MIIVVAGLPGSGKSYLANRLSKKLKAPIYSSDQIRKDIGDGYDTKIKLLVYREIGRRLITSDAPFKLVDATCSKKNYRNILKNAAAERNEPVAFIELTASEEIVRQRVSRKRKYSEADYGVYRKIKSEFEPIEESDHLIIDSTNEHGDIVEKALKFVYQERQRHE